MEDLREKYSSFIDKYNNCFYERNVNALREMYAQNEDIIFFDNHEGCDSYSLQDHIDKVVNFIESGDIEKLSYRIIKVFEGKQNTCLIVKFIYPSKPVPSVRATFYLANEHNELKIKHIHYSFDPNES